MLDCLPQTIEPIGLADAGRSFRGEIAVSEFERLRPLLADTDGVLQVSLSLRRDERGMRVAEGSIAGEIRLVCQRCLQAMEFPLQVEFRLAIVTSEAEIEPLPPGYEPLLATGELLRTAEVIEDEVLLRIPAVAMHSGVGRCDSGYRNRPVAEKDNPFSILEKLKT